MSWLYALVIVALAVVLFTSGRHLGRAEVTADWEKDTIARDAEELDNAAHQIKALSAALARAATAEAANLAARAELDRLRAATHLRGMRCTANPDPGVSASPAAGSHPDTGTGELREGAVFDPGPGLLKLARRADAFVEACRVLAGD